MSTIRTLQRILAGSGFAVTIGWQPVQAPTRYYEFTYEKDPQGPYVVHASINESPPITMWLDTGTSSIILTGAFVHRLGLTMRAPIGSDGQPIQPGFHKINWLGIVRLTNIRIGDDCLFQGPEALVMEQSVLRRAMNSPIDGILGMQLFSRASALFDFQRQSVRIYYPPTLSQSEMEEAGMRGAVEIPIEVRDYTVYAMLTFPGERTEQLLIDTGAPQTSISTALARHLGLKPMTHRESGSLSGIRKVTVSRIPSVRIGALEVPDFPVEYMEDEKRQYRPVLGEDVLSRFRILIDVPGRKMYLKPVRADPFNQCTGVTRGDRACVPAGSMEYMLTSGRARCRAVGSRGGG